MALTPWDVTDVPPIPDEEWMPPSSFLYKVNFYYSFAHDAADYWLSEGKLWSKDVDKFAEPSKTIKAAVDGLIAPGDSRPPTRQRSSTPPCKLSTTPITRAARAKQRLKQLKLKSGPARPKTPGRRRADRVKTSAMLYLAMLRAAGLPRMR